MSATFLELGIIVIAAVLIGAILNKLKQPLVLSYIFAGLIIGPILGLVKTEGSTELMTNLGITLLLFLIGLELNIKELKHIGLISVVTGIGQFVFAFLAGNTLALYLGFSAIESLFLGIALTFSSTIIVVKILSEKNELYTLHGKIAIGFLIVQDILAIIVLMVLAGINNSGTATSSTLVTILPILKGIFLIMFAAISGNYAVPYLFRYFAKSQELLFLGSIAWCFFYSILSYYLGFSFEIGAFLAGLSLASSPYSLEISSRIKPLRNFFITVFFVVLGATLGFSFSPEILIPSIILAVFVIIFDPLIIIVLMSLFGYKKRTSFLTGITSAQVSEFSLIIIAIAFGMGYVSKEVVSIVTMTAVLTIVISSYLIIHSHKIYMMISHHLSFFERKDIQNKKINYFNEHNHAIVFGYHRIGTHIIQVLKKSKIPFIVIDYDPDTEDVLSKKNIPHIYGDASDPEILETIGISKAKLVISTVPEYHDNMLIIKKVKIWKNVRVIVTANQIKEALELYDAGADYVIVPHHLGGEKFETMLEDFLKAPGKVSKERTKHLNVLYAHLNHNVDKDYFNHN